MAPATTRSELRRFVRDLRWIVPLWLAAAIGFGVYAGIDDGVSSGLTIGGGCVVLGIAFASIVDELLAAAPVVATTWRVPAGPPAWRRRPLQVRRGRGGGRRR